MKAARQVIGATNPLEAAPGSIRGDFAIEVGQNMVHGSDSAESGRARGEPVLPRALSPRVRVAAAARDPRAGRASPFDGRARRRRGADGRRPARGRRGERAPQGAGGRPRRRPRARRRHDRRARRRHPRQAARRGAGARVRRRAWPAARTRSSAAIALAARRRGRRRPPSRSPQVRFRAARAPRMLDWYVATGEWEGRAGGYAIQGARRGARRGAIDGRLPQRRRAAARAPARPPAALAVCSTISTR